MNHTTNFFFRCAVAEGPAARLRERALKPMPIDRPRPRQTVPANRKEHKSSLERHKNKYI